MSGENQDRIGLTWHPALAANILAHSDRLDIVEVIPEEVFLDSRKGRRALRTLARAIPVAIHGVSLGLSSADRVDGRRLDAFARLIDEVVPEHWSEHLAFVRAGGIELGHLAAPTRTALTVEATAENLYRAHKRVGSPPLVENVASLIEPPGSDRSEETWLLELLGASPSDLLLDLHNVVTNGQNFGYDPRALVEALPVDRIRAIHVAGGTEVCATSGDTRLLDDHRHAVPDSVYSLLELIGERVPHPIDVILERDGAFPPFPQLLAELDRARAALSAGRARRQAVVERRQATGLCWPLDVKEAARPPDAARSRHLRLESLLAQLYTDTSARNRFLEAPAAEARRAGLDGDDLDAIVALDRAGLELAAASFARKRKHSERNARH